MFGLDPVSLSIGIGLALIGGPAVKNIVVLFFPVTAPIFAKIDIAQRQLLKMVKGSDSIDEQKALEHAKETGLKAGVKLLENLIKKK